MSTSNPGCNHGPDNEYQKALKWAQKNSKKADDGQPGINWFWLIVVLIAIAVVFWVYVKYFAYNVPAPIYPVHRIPQGPVAIATPVPAAPAPKAAPVKASTPRESKFLVSPRGTIYRE